MDDDKIKLGVLWKNVSREGKNPYMSGRVQQDNLDAAMQLLRDGGRFLILGNTKRPNKQDPDCVLFVVPEPERCEARTAPPAAAQQRTTPGVDQGRQRTAVGSRPSR